MPVASIVAHWLNGWGQSNQSSSSAGRPDYYPLGGPSYGHHPKKKKTRHEETFNVLVKLEAHNARESRINDIRTHQKRQRQIAVLVAVDEL